MKNAWNPGDHPSPLTQLHNYSQSKHPPDLGWRPAYYKSLNDLFEKSLKCFGLPLSVSS